jgi:hypothetical protein
MPAEGRCHVVGWVDIAIYPAPPPRGVCLHSANASVPYRRTEPVLAPVRRVARPVRLGGVVFNIAVTLVFFAVVVLRHLVLVT